MEKGKLGWIPASVVDEIKDIKRENGVKKDALAMHKMVEYARVGREFERIKKLDFSRAMKRTPLSKFNQNSGRKKKK